MQLPPNVEYWLRVMTVGVPAISAIVVAVVSYRLSRRMEPHKSQLQTALQTKLYVMALLEDRFRKLLEAEAPYYQPYRKGPRDGGRDKKQLSEPGFWRRIGRLWWRRPKERSNT